MKQVTEFHGLLLQNAVKASGHLTPPAPEKKAPAEKTEAKADAAPAEDAPAEGEGEVEGEVEGEGDAESAEQAEQPVETAAPAAEAAPVAAGAHAEYRAALEQAIAAALKLEGERLARMADAVELFGRQAQKARLVRVFKAGEAPSNAKVLGEFAYVVDFVQDQGGDRGGRRGGKGRGKRPGGQGEGRGPRPNENEGSLMGGFSMDALAQDRKSRLAHSGKGGGPGGGRGRPGGRGRGPRGPEVQRADGAPAPGGGERRGPRPGGDRRPGGPGGNRPQGQRPQGPRPQGPRPQQNAQMTEKPRAPQTDAPKA